MSGELVRFLWRYWKLYALLVVVLLCSAVVETVGVGALFPLMSALLGQDMAGSGGRLLGLIESAADALPFDDRLVSAAWLLFGIISVRAAVLILRESLIVSVSATVVKRVKQEMFTKLLHAPYAYFLDQNRENLSYRLTKAPEHLGLLLFLVPSALAQGLIIVAILVLLTTTSWKLVLALLGAGVGLYVLLRQVARRVSHMAGHRRAAASAQELNTAQEFLAGIKEIIVAQTGHRWGDRYLLHGEEIRRVGIKDGVWQALPGILIEWMFFAVVIVSLVTIAGSRGSQGVAHAVPMMSVYLYATYRLIRALSIMSAYKLRISSQLADVELLSETLNELPDEHCEILPLEPRALTFSDRIQFAGVSFTYPGRFEPALDDVTLDIPQGTVTAFVGRSGAGKTTLVNLLLGLYEPTAGAVRLDGQDLGDIPLQRWRSLVGYVSQEAFILSGSVRENISFGLAECTDADIESSAKSAYAHDFIVKLPQGYGTFVGERGSTLSGGQRQRVAIARALVRKPEILIFDEATSQLDNHSETLIQKAIADVSRTHTVIIVAHRLSMVKIADQIVVLDHGRVVECGRHEDLIARKGQYSLMLAGS